MRLLRRCTPRNDRGLYKHYQSRERHSRTNQIHLSWINLTIHILSVLRGSKGLFRQPLLLAWIIRNLGLMHIRMIRCLNPTPQQFLLTLEWNTWLLNFVSQDVFLIWVFTMFNLSEFFRFLQRPHYQTLERKKDECSIYSNNNLFTIASDYRVNKFIQYHYSSCVFNPSNWWNTGNPCFTKRTSLGLFLFNRDFCTSHGRGHF